MTSSSETDNSRTRTDQNLQVERERSDVEVLVGVDAIGEESEAVVVRARARARTILEVARKREDQHLAATESAADVSAILQRDRGTEDVKLAAERSVEDAQRQDERERRRVAMIQLLAHERDATDHTLAAERFLADAGISAREDLLAHVAHDLRNMLTAIMVNASVILVARDLERVGSPAAHIQRVGAQMARLLEDLLDVSSLEAGRQTLATADIDLAQIVRDAVSIYEEVARAQGLHMTIRLEVKSLIVHADGRRLTRLLINLLSNAVKFTAEGGRIDVSLTASENTCEVAVADTGVGIPHDQLESIFERFHRVTEEKSPRPYGVGLGLYIARLIANAHGGEVVAESEPSAGSTFRLRLPLKQSAV